MALGQHTKVVISLLYNTPSKLVKLLLLESTSIFVKALQEENAPSPIEVTLLGIVIDVRNEQLLNAKLLIELTLLGIVIEVRDEQPKNALFPIELTLLGIVIEVRDEQ